MPIKRKLAMALLCLPLALGAMFGGPMPPEEIEKLLHASHLQEIAYVLEGEQRENGLEPDTDLDPPHEP
jgi:hypothetical protein